MSKRPLAVTVISLVLIATGGIGFVFHLIDSRARDPFPYDILWISLVSLVAILSGVYMLRASNWARWLSIAWIAFHVILSAFHSRFQLGFHIFVFAVFAYFLSRPGTNQYFRGSAA